jgi:hypothetical protein
MAVEQFNLAQGQRAERKTLITVAAWDEYTLLESAPADWSTNYTDYYTKSGNVYTHVTGSEAPTFETNKYYKGEEVRDILGTRTEDSSIEFNPDIETTTDIRGNSYTDMNKTEPEQSFDPFLILGGSKLAPKLHDIMFRNAVSELNQFTMYIITAYIGDETNGYKAQRQTECTITYDSLGGDTKVNFPITVHYSNKSTPGTVDKLSDDFEFTPDVTV